MDFRSFIAVSFLVTALLIDTQAKAQGEVQPLTDEDYKAIQEQTGFKSGLNLMALPIASYSSDFGLQFGAYLDFYDYGTQPSIFPEYWHKFHIEASHYTKGQTFVHAEYDSEHLIPDVRLSASMSWQKDPMCHFYGFNGSVCPYDSSLDFKNGIAYYNFSRNMLRFLCSASGHITGELSWLAGISAYRYVTDTFQFEGYDNSHTLYDKFRKEGIIMDNEASGALMEFKAGLSWDSRDFEPAPSSGTWAELYLSGAPDLARSGHQYMKVSAHLRQYFTPGPDWLTLAYHLGWQGTIAGNAPFYVQQNVSTVLIRQACAEGLGGINTIRGILGNRLIGNDYCWTNIESRIRLVKWMMFGDEWYIGINPFTDIGFISRPYRLQEMVDAGYGNYEDLDREARRAHASAGMGFKLGLNKNLILSYEGAKAFRNDDGPFCSYFAINYIF